MASSGTMGPLEVEAGLVAGAAVVEEAREAMKLVQELQLTNAAYVRNFEAVESAHDTSFALFSLTYVYMYFHPPAPADS